MERKWGWGGDRLKRRKDHPSFGAVNHGLAEDWPRNVMKLGLGKEHLRLVRRGAGKGTVVSGHSLKATICSISWPKIGPPKPACQMELRVQVLLICSQFACILSVIAL